MFSGARCCVARTSFGSALNMLSTSAFPIARGRIGVAAVAVATPVSKASTRSPASRARSDANAATRSCCCVRHATALDAGSALLAQMVVSSPSAAVSTRFAGSGAPGSAPSAAAPPARIGDGDSSSLTMDAEAVDAAGEVVASAAGAADATGAVAACCAARPAPSEALSAVASALAICVANGV